MATVTATAGQMPSAAANTETAPRPPEPPQDVKIHPSGGVYLCTPTKRFEVFTTALGLSSPVFARMLDPSSPFLEGRQLASNSKNSPAQVALNEDDSEALEIILNIAHHRGENVPKWLEPEKMFAVATLCDKYDMTAALSGYASAWTGKLTLEDVKGKDAIRWLAVAWAFKNDCLVEDVTEYLIKNVKYHVVKEGSTNREGGSGPGKRRLKRKDLADKVVLTFADGTELCTDGIPTKVLDALNNATIALHNSLVRIAYSHANPLLTTITPLCKHNLAACDRLQLGTLLRYISLAGVPVLPNFHDGLETLPFISAVEIVATFSKDENLSNILPQVTFDLATRAGREAAREAAKEARVANVTPRVSTTTTTRARGGQKEKEKEVPHGECSVVKKVRKEMLERMKDVRGLRGLL